MLDRVRDPDALATAIQEHVTPFCRRHGVTADPLLADHVAELCEAISAMPNDGAEDGERHLEQASPAPHGDGDALVVTRPLLERRATAIVRCINDVDVRVDSVLKVLRAAGVPYIDEVHQLSNDALNWPGRRLDEVRSCRAACRERSSVREGLCSSSCA